MNTKVFKYLYTQFDKKCLRLIRFLDGHITRNLYDAGVETRPARSNGLWCCCLIPTVFVIYSILYRVSILYRLVAYVSIGILSYSFLFIVFMSVSCLVLKETIYGGCIASSLISVLLLYIFMGQGLVLSLLLSLPSVVTYSLLLRISLTKFPKTYTIGEAMIVTQSVVLYGVMTVAKVMLNVDDANDQEMDFINSIVTTMLSTVGLIVTALYLWPEKQRDLQHLGYILIAGTIYALIILHSVLGVTCIVRILNYIFMDQIRVQLFTFWLFLLLMAVFILLVRTKLAVKATTVARKSFHVMASMVFLSGIICDVYFTTLAAGLGFGLLILVEALRKSGIEPVSSVLNSAFLVYSDEKDGGSFAMTPIYLYAGLACPLLLVPMHGGRQLELLSGVLSIGVGDSAASWFGSRYGFNKWADGHKTLEGTTFNILSQVATVYALNMFELLKTKNSLMRAAFAATISGLVEARTDQVDNLILPLITILAYQATWFLC